MAQSLDYRITTRYLGGAAWAALRRDAEQATSHVRRVNADMGRAWRESGREVGFVGMAVQGMGRRAGGALSSLLGTVRGVTGGVVGLAGEISGRLVGAMEGAISTGIRLGAVFGTTVAIALATTAKSGVQMNVAMNASRVGLTAITGSAAAGGRALTSLRASANNLGMGIREAVEQGQGLIAVYGPQGLGQALRTMRAFSAAGRVLAGSDPNATGRALTQFRQLAASQNPQGDELRILEENLPGSNVRQSAVKRWGTSKGDELARLGVSGMDLANAIVEDFEARFVPAMSKLGDTIPFLFQRGLNGLVMLAEKATGGLTGSIGKGLGILVAQIERLAGNERVVAALAVPFNLLGRAIEIAAAQLPAFASWLEQVATRENVVGIIASVGAAVKTVGQEVGRLVSAVTGEAGPGAAFRGFGEIALKAIDFAMRSWSAFTEVIEYFGQHSKEIWGLFAEGVNVGIQAVEVLTGAFVVLTGLKVAGWLVTVGSHLWNIARAAKVAGAATATVGAAATGTAAAGAGAGAAAGGGTAAVVGGAAGFRAALKGGPALFGGAARVASGASRLRGGLIGAGAGLLADWGLSYLPDQGGMGTFKGTARGAVAGAGWGALAGSIVPGIGTAAGAIAGGVIGGGIGLWNSYVHGDEAAGGMSQEQFEKTQAHFRQRAGASPTRIGDQRADLPGPLGVLQGIGRGARGAAGWGANRLFNNLPDRIQNLAQGAVAAGQRGWRQGGISQFMGRFQQNRGEMETLINQLLGPVPPSPQTRPGGMGGPGGVPAGGAAGAGGPVGRTAQSAKERDKVLKEWKAGMAALWEARVEAVRAEIAALPAPMQSMAEVQRLIPALQEQQKAIRSMTEGYAKNTAEYYQGVRRYWDIQEQIGKIQEKAGKEQEQRTERQFEALRKRAKDAAELAGAQAQLVRERVENNPLLSGKQRRDALLPALKGQFAVLNRSVAGETDLERTRRLIEAEGVRGEILKAAGMDKTVRLTGGAVAPVAGKRQMSALMTELDAIAARAGSSGAGGGQTTVINVQGATYNVNGPGREELIRTLRTMQQADLDRLLREAGLGR